jgi:hypothetical protein
MRAKEAGGSHREVVQDGERRVQMMLRETLKVGWEELGKNLRIGKGRRNRREKPESGNETNVRGGGI